jgi:hypothetical protein
MKTLKCLSEGQMKYILDNHKEKTARQMTDALQIEHHKVTLFCQANGYEPFQDRITILRKNKDSFHNIPPSKRQKMKTERYNKQINH